METNLNKTQIGEKKMTQQEIYEARKTSKTAREVTFMGCTSLIDPIADQKRVEKDFLEGNITGVAYYKMVRAFHRQMNAGEKEMDYTDLNN